MNVQTVQIYQRQIFTLEQRIDQKLSESSGGVSTCFKPLEVKLGPGPGLGDLKVPPAGSTAQAQAAFQEVIAITSTARDGIPVNLYHQRRITASDSERLPPATEFRKRLRAITASHGIP